MKFFRMRKLMKLREKLERQIELQNLYHTFDVTSNELETLYKKYDEASDMKSKRLYFEQILNATDRQLRLLDEIDKIA